MADKPESDVEMGMGETPSDTTSPAKGKGVAAEPEIEDDESSDEEATGADDAMDEDPVTEDEDDLAEIDTSNIVSSSRRRKPVDYAKAAADMGKELEEDEDGDGDFVAKEEAEA